MQMTDMCHLMQWNLLINTDSGHYSDKSGKYQYNNVLICGNKVWSQ